MEPALTLPGDLRDLLQALLPPATPEGLLPGGFATRAVRLSQALELDLARGETRLTVRLLPPDPAVPAFRHGPGHALGYRGDLSDPAARDLLESLHRRLCAAGAGALQPLWDWRDRRGPFDSATAARPAPAPTAPPRSAETVLRLTLACDEACPFCNTDRCTPNLYPDREACREALRQVAAAGGRRVSFSGGEPFLVPWLPDVVRQARGLGLEVAVQTNGVLAARPGTWERFRDGDGPCLPHRLVVSFHTARADRLPDLTGRAGTFDDKVAAVRQALDRGVQVALSLVVSALNLDEVPAFPDFAADTFGPRVEVMISAMAPTGKGASRLDLGVPPTALGAALRPALDAAARRGLTVHVPDRCGMPPCLAPAHPGAFDQLRSGRPADAAAMEGRAKGPRCGRCRLDPWCSGIWQAWADRFGFDGLEPLADPDPRPPTRRTP